jgi:hypothetical protein
MFFSPAAVMEIAMISGRLEEYVSYVRLSELANIAPARLAGAVRIRELTVSVCKKRCVLPLCESSGTLSSSSYPGSDGMGVHWSEAIFGEWDKGEDKKNRRRSSSSFETFPPPFDDPLGRTGICEQAMARMTFCPQQRRLANTSSRCTQKEEQEQEAGSRDSMSQSQTGRVRTSAIQWKKGVLWERNLVPVQKCVRGG